VAARFIVHCKITGPGIGASDGDDLVQAASGLEGYMLSLIYRPVASRAKDAHLPLRPEANGGDGIALDGNGTLQEEPYLIVIHAHECAVQDKGVETLVRAFEERRGSRDVVCSVRAYELVSSEGFDGVCRTPERLEAV
ncbi:hypothetical protein LTR53_015873, partial [Teratosphaeriaceae sp. CCFEE 6253]